MKGGNRMRLFVLMFTLFLTIGLSSCATNKDFEAVRALAEQANATAEAARVESMNATNTANEALSIAQDAKARTEATEIKLDRMFNKTMEK